MAKSGNKTKAQTMIYKTLQVQIKIEHHEPHKKPMVNSWALEGLALPVPLVTRI